MKITRLTAENIKRIKAVDITPDGNLVVIGGRNAQGKTSVLDSITYALAGATAIPDMPIRKGEDKAKVVCELDDLIVTRTFTKAGGGTLTVTNKEGAKYPTPQAILDKLIGTLTFDPLAFSRMPPAKQLETLKSLVGLDFTEMDAERQALYDERTLVNRDHKKLTSQVDGMPEYPDVPDDEVSVSELMKELRREVHNVAHSAKRKELDQATDEVVNQAHELRRLEVMLEAQNMKLQELKSTQQELKVEVDTLHDTDESEIRKQIEGADMISRKVRSNRVRAQRKQALDTKQNESNRISAEIQSIDDAKSEALATASFPVPDLSFDESGVLFNKLPLNQACSTEQLRVSVGIGLAMNPELKVLLIREGSLLDAENLQVIAEMVSADDAQAWIERVGEGDEVSVIIEDGTVRHLQNHRVLI